MIEELGSSGSKKKHIRLPFGFMALLLLSLVLGWQTVAKIEHEMRADFLQQSLLVAQAMDVAKVSEFTGTEADLASPDYQQFKKQLMAVRSANPQCRFVYLVGRTADGTIFFFVDSEPTDSADYSLPGQPLTEASEKFSRMFDTQTEFVEGPVTDRWGTWVSALAPLLDPQNGKVLAVLGMDVDSRDWNFAVFAEAALPVGLMLIMLIFTAISLSAAGINVTNPARNNRYIAWIVLVAGLVITFLISLYIKTITERRAEQDFAAQCCEIQHKITERLYGDARDLRGGAAFFSASEAVTRDEWRAYIQRQKSEQQLLCLQGIGFSLLIQPAELVQHIQEIRSEGFPEYTVKPTGDREIYTAIIYLEPFDVRNQRAFGYDMFSEPVRRVAMERARDEDVAELSGKVRLVQAPCEDGQSGILMYVPVYRHGMPTDSVEQRRAAIYGWVYSSYRIRGLMQGVFRGFSPQKETQLHLELFDGAQPVPQNLLYESAPLSEKDSRFKTCFSQLIPIDFNGHRWTLQLVQAVGGLFTAAYVLVWLTLTGGTVITLALFALIGVLLNTHSEAQRIAQKLTVDIREGEEKYRTVADYTNDWESWLSPDGTYRYVSPSCERITGYRDEEFLHDPMLLVRIAHPDDRDFVSAHLQDDNDGTKGKETYEVDFRIITRAGEQRWVSHICRGVYGLNGQYFGRRSSTRDITARKQIEDELKLSRKRLEDIIEFLPEASMGIDLEKKVIIWNEAMEEMTGIPATEMLGKGDYAYTIPFYGEPRPQLMDLLFEDLDKTAAMYSQITRRGKILEIEHFCGALRGGKGAWVFSKAAPLRDLSGNIVGAIQSTFDITDRKQAEERARHLAQRLETVREEEHKHLARELHDDIGQILAALKIDLVMMDNEDPREGGGKKIMSDMQKLLDEGVQSVRSLCGQLRPCALDDLSLAEALNGLVGNWKKRNAVACTLCADIDDEFLSDEIKTAVFRIVQEALTNVARHANASQVEVNLVADEQTLNFSIRDNGCGMTASEENKPVAFGLLGMRERIEALGGELDIESTPHAGTRIDGSIPLSRVINTAEQ